MHLDIPYLLKHLTLEEKAGLCSGADNWWTKAVQRLGIPAIMVSDGPHGLRTQTEQVNGRYVGAVPAICFPSGSALASSFDADLLEKVGSALGEEAAGQKVHTVLGPAVNMKRSPLCGRNFEYLSEDPYLAGKLAASYIKGVQKHGVGVSLKHFAANNQEKSRMNINELMTVGRENLPIIEVVINNHVLGMVYQWQDLFYGRRFSATVLNDKADFCKIAEGMGVSACRVSTQEEFRKAIAEAVRERKPKLIEAVIASEDMVFPMCSPGAALSDTFDAEDLKIKQGRT